MSAKTLKFGKRPSVQTAKTEADLAHARAQVLAWLGSKADPDDVDRHARRIAAR